MEKYLDLKNPTTRTILVVGVVVAGIVAVNRLSTGIQSAATSVGSGLGQAESSVGSGVGTGVAIGIPVAALGLLLLL